jgi:MoaA/NifB/PqqE/SkfB family radical SAM enzyme
MNHDKHQNNIKHYSCRKAIPVMLKFRFSLLKYLFQRRKYPLFILRSDKGGLLKSYKIQKKLLLGKFAGYNNHYYFSLNVPHWPSRAFDNMVANGGLNINMAGTAKKKHIDTVIIGITRKCNYKCSHCYENFNLGVDDEIPLAKWKEVISELQDLGVSILTLSGGEPMMRYEDILEILWSSDHSKSDFHIHTSGFGVTPAKAVELRKAGLHAAGVGLDDYDSARNDNLRDFKGAHEQAINSIKYFQNAGIFTYVNSCLTKELIGSGELKKYFELMKKLNVGIIRWLEPKPCGGYFNSDQTIFLNSDDNKILTEFYIKANTAPEYGDYPLISYEAFYETPENMGCMMAGNSQLYIDTAGNVQPCVFFPVSFGNIMKEHFPDILRKMRDAVPGPLKIQCPSFLLNSEIRNLKDGGYPVPVPFEEIITELSALVNSG